MTFRTAIDVFIDDMKSQGRLNSPRSEVSYRAGLMRLADQVDNRDPRTVGREDIKRTLALWKHPNTQARNRSMMVSFFDWHVEEGQMPYNPARQTRRPRQRKPQIYRLTFEEVGRLLAAATGQRERRLVYLGVCAGLRRAELVGLQGRHFTRPGWVWVSADIAKGSKERWIPIVSDLAVIIEEIQRTVGLEDYVFPSQQFSDPPRNSVARDYPTKQGDAKAIWRLLKKVAKRAGIPGNVTPHTMRHAFTDHVARFAGLRAAQSALGHASLSTTEGYLGMPTLDELAAAFEGLNFATPGATTLNPADGDGGNRTHASAPPSGDHIPFESEAWLEEQFARLDPTVELYIRKFAEVGT